MNWRNFPPVALPYQGTAQTAAHMEKMALAAQTSWPLRRLVEKVCIGIAPKDYLSEFLALHHLVCRCIRYMRDPRTVELVIVKDYRHESCEVHLERSGFRGR